MKGGVGYYLVGAGVLLALAGCGRSFFSGERAPWRHQAEVECMKSGAVKLGAGVVRIEPIEGPGICGADFPLKVAALGEGPAAIGYGDDLRPPGAIPNASQMPNWPIDEPRYTPPAPVGRMDVQQSPAQSAQPHMRWVPGPPPAERSQPARSAPPPVDLRPPVARDAAPGAAPLPDDIPDDAILPERTYPPQRAQSAPVYQPPPQSAPVYQQPLRSAPVLGPARAPQVAAALPAALTPAATLACPIVSALDRWVSDAVQPAAMRWFGSQVVEIKQISSYSCRGMVGSGGSGISEHAFGNALDIAAFTLADGRRITVQDGWHGTPEEQGFLRDIHLAACDNFNTVLAPGYNAAHYNHIHVDLMRRASGDRPCRPEPVSGAVAAAKARALYARQRGPAFTGSMSRSGKVSRAAAAVPGEDGYILDLDDVTRSILPAEARGRSAPRLTTH
ncbi:MAG TPA: extensin family protein [Pseudolabrys sp.]|nr:extensin family protein [Pseudolabrys sp.]